MNRQAKRQQARKDDKVRNKMYTFNECHQITQKMIQQTKAEYDARYSLCLATAVSSPPYNFGKKRVCGVLGLFFDQVKALEEKTIDEDDVRKIAKKLGVLVQEENDTLAVYLDPTGKFETEET